MRLGSSLLQLPWTALYVRAFSVICKALHSRLLDSAPAGRPIFFLCPSSIAEKTYFRSVPSHIAWKATTASVRSEFCLRNFLSRGGSNKPVTEAGVYLKERLASRRAGSNAMSAVHLNQSLFGSRASQRTAGELGTAPSKQMGRGLRQPRDRVCVSSEGT